MTATPLPVSTPSDAALQAATEFMAAGFTADDMNLWTTLGPKRLEIKAGMDYLAEEAIRSELCKLAGEIRQRFGLEPADLGDVGLPMVLAEAAEACPRDAAAVQG